MLNYIFFTINIVYYIFNLPLVDSKSRDLPGCSLNLAALRARKAETEETGRSLQLVDGRFNKQGNLCGRPGLGGQEMR